MEGREEGEKEGRKETFTKLRGNIHFVGGRELEKKKRKNKNYSYSQRDE